MLSDLPRSTRDCAASAPWEKDAGTPAGVPTLRLAQALNRKLDAGSGEAIPRTGSLAEAV
jgi:hypothetical protein